MSDEPEAEVPEGAAVFPDIPEDLGVNPLLLAVLQAAVFLAGSSEEVVHPAAADEVLQGLAGYLQRLRGPQLRQVREDMGCLIAYARQQQWPRQFVQALRTFLDDCGVEEQEEA
jgi:hypothetical protein